ncbi:MAG TPA: phosphoribosyltransferase family protein [Blastocatellia bacterium]|nr:phosphoribosyltransferase family protein [Blastocatellia bacterium]
MKCILVDDVVRSGKVINYMVSLIKEAGAEVIAIGSLVHFNKAKLEIGAIPYRSLINVDCDFYAPDECPQCKAGIPVEKVWA